MEKLVPLGDRLVLKPIKQGERTLASGLVIPEGVTEKPQVAEIVAVGEDVERVKSGDKVMYAFYAGQSIILGQVEYVVIAEEEILCRVEENNAK